MLLFLLEAGGALAALALDFQDNRPPIAPDRGLPALSLFGIFALLLFLFGRFSATIARLENHRLLRPGANFLLSGRLYLFRPRRWAIAGVQAEFPKADLLRRPRACACCSGRWLLEILVALMLEIYRPRMKGKISRPVYDSRFVGLLGQPESLFTTAAKTIDYQFGFNVSETWFFQLVKQNLLVLLLGAIRGAAVVHLRRFC